MPEPRQRSSLGEGLNLLAGIVLALVIGWRILIWAHVIEDGLPFVGRAAESIWNASDPNR